MGVEPLWGVTVLEACIEGLLAVLTSQNYTLDVLEVALHHIRFALPHPLPPFQPGREYPPMSDAIRGAAICAKELLHTIMLVCPPQTPLKKATQDMLMKHLDDILDCQNFLLWYPDASNVPPGQSIANPAKACVAFIELIRNGDAPARAALLSSEKLIDFAIGAWVLRASDDYPYITMSHGKERCPIATLLLEVLHYSPDNKQRAFDILCGHSRTSRFLRKRAIDNAIARYEEFANNDRNTLESTMRAQQAMIARINPEAYDTPISGLDTALLYLDSVTRVVSVLCEDPILARDILESGVFDAFCETLKHWMVYQSDRETDRQDRYLGFQLLSLAQSIVQYYYVVFRKLCVAVHLGMAESGLFLVLVEGLQSVPKRDLNSKHLSDVLDRLKYLCKVSPSAAGMLEEPLVRARGREYWDTSFLRGSGYEKAWKLLGRDIRAGATLSTQKQPMICDNLNCPGDRKNEKRRTCGRCHTMVYCSKSCQAADWELQHQAECYLAKEADEGGRHSGIMQYRQALRLSQATFANRLANLIFREDNLTLDHSGQNAILGLFDDGYSTYSPSDFLVRHGYVAPSVDTQAPLGVTVNLTSNHYLDKRFQRLALHYGLHGKDQDLCLVEATFVFGRRPVAVLALLQKTSRCDPAEDSPANPYTLRYCVTRILSRRI
ncbi:hypothetical protein DFP72DRAFT_90836 [Ephemerocybe angulata]|uniref:MYND-type domain-containing protein n=1 Tax=Ephemerocybe angulata TaxID=980116 RepID=A0A8H6HBJ0_9AGAR|nr:hypothetical protein DFP72DRAFT_90836 [Tulosesus angulatus]